MATSVDRVDGGEHVTVTRFGPAGRRAPTGSPDRPLQRGVDRAAATSSPRRTGAAGNRYRRRHRSAAVIASGTRGLLDTSTLILLGRIADPATLPDEPLISVVTLAELSVGPLVPVSGEERAARQAHLQQAEADVDALVFDAAAARRFGHVAASLRRAGRKTLARAYDAMIAATARRRRAGSHVQSPRLLRHRRSDRGPRPSSRRVIATTVARHGRTT